VNFIVAHLLSEEFLRNHLTDALCYILSTDIFAYTVYLTRTTRVDPKGHSLRYGRDTLGGEHYASAMHHQYVRYFNRRFVRGGKKYSGTW